MKKIGKWISMMLVSAMFVGTAASPLTGVMAETAAGSNGIKEVISVTADENSYLYYYEKYRNSEKPVASIEVTPNHTNTEQDGKSAVLLGGADRFFAAFTVEKEGRYSLCVDYHDTEENVSAMLIGVEIDGTAPFKEAAGVGLNGLYTDDVADGKFLTDKYENDIRPSASEKYAWLSASLSDSNSLYSEPYLFYLTAGEHTVEVFSENRIGISKLCFYNDAEPVSYDEYIKSYEQKNSDTVVRQEAELIYEKNSDNIYPTYEKADAATLPSSAASIKLNTVGQGNWSRQGQFIRWKADVKKAGLYSVTFRVNQSYNENGSSYRRFTVNGKVPFREADCIEFPYAIRWYTKTIGDDRPMYVWLEPGDVIALEVTVDKTSEISRSISTCLTDMSTVYREIFVITGAQPDVYTDYNLDVKIPTLMDSLKSIKKQLENSISLIRKQTGKKTSAASTLSEVLETVEKMIDKPYNIHRYVSSLSDDIASMGSLIMTVGQQPLELDCFYFSGVGARIPNGKVSFIKRTAYGLRRYLYSYSSDYGSFTEKTDKLKVWVSTGRDQLQIIQRMIEDDFENSHDAKIELSLVDTGSTLIKATIAGKGPDVALNIESGTPINLAIRGALTDLTKYDVDAVYNDFYDSAWTPYRHRDSIYAIPETQVFDVIFYRTDLFELLDLEVPSTWEEFYEVMEVLQRNNFEVGIPEIGANAGVSAGISTFARFLLQSGGTYYTEDYKKTAFDSIPSYRAFTEWVELYSKYGLERSFDFFNRFRTGVMALSIQPYSTYNQVFVSAPEIRGCWGMAPIPGTVREDGTVNRAENSSGTGCIMLKSAEKKGLGKEAFSFMTWWTNGNTQLRYAKELEATMGIAARYTPASKKAFENLGWTASELSVLTAQMKEIVNFREVPGNYVLPRALTSAFRKALTSTDLPERQLELYNQDINDELARKAKEFHLY